MGIDRDLNSSSLNNLDKACTLLVCKNCNIKIDFLKKFNATRVATFGEERLNSNLNLKIKFSFLITLDIKHI